ncbi:hypothetical protein QAD02_013987, partial [Eretmocerus hayati]
SKSGCDSSCTEESDNECKLSGCDQNFIQTTSSDGVKSTNTDDAVTRGKLTNKGRWTKEEDALLKQLVSCVEEMENGIRWDEVAMHFGDRNEIQCQQRWAKVVNPELIKGPWTKE